jgi:hypothetical protein
LLNSPDGTADALTVDRIEAALLQGVVDIARSLTGAGQDVTIQGALLVKYVAREGKGGKQVPYLRVSNRNRLAGQRGWSKFRLDSPGPAQEAYRDGHAVAVPDTQAPQYAGVFRGKMYRSVLALPVRLECSDGRRLAVVSLDADAAGVFSEKVIEKGIELAVGPYLKLLGLARLHETKGLSND